eukprot:EG_transcript_8045
MAPAQPERRPLLSDGPAERRLKGDVPVSRYLYGCVATAVLGSFLFGYNTGAITAALLYIDEEFGLDPWTKGLLVASVLVGAMLGAGGCILLSDRIGRRKSLLGSNLFYLPGALGMALAPSLVALVAFRFCAGVGVGISSSEVNKYIGELVPSHRRGFFGGVAPLAVTSGILSSYLFGLAMGGVPGGWRWILGLAALPSFLMLLLQCFLPESPRWLLLRSLRRPGTPGEAEARHTLERMYAPHPHRAAWVDREIADLRRGILESVPQCDVSGHSECGSLTSRVPQDAAGVLGFWHALAVGAGLHMLQQGAGVNVVIYYSAMILKEGGFTDREAMLLTSGVGFVQLLVYFATLTVVDRVGRRPLALFGITGMAVAHALLAASTVPELWQDAWLAPSWVACGSMLLFRVMFSLSLGPLPFIIAAEVFPLPRRSLGIGAAWMTNWLANVTVCLSFPVLREALSPAAVFGTYGAICAGAFFFVWFVVPETKGVARDGAHARADALLEALLGPEEEDGECASRDAGRSDKCPSPACHPATTPLGPEPEALTH